MNLAPLLPRAALLYGSEAAVRCGTTSWSYAELEREAHDLARRLAALGIGRGDRVALLHRNCHRFVKTAFAAVFGGQTLVPLNVRLDPGSLGEMLVDAGAKALLTEPSLEPLARQAARRAKGVEVFDVEGVPEAPRAPDLPKAPPLPGDVAWIVYTSGTTGRARGAMLTHGNVASHALMAIAELGLSDRDVWAHVAPMFHLADAWAIFAVTAVGGVHVVFPDFEAAAILDGFEREGVTITNLVPTMLHRLVSDPSAGGRRFPALRAILSGGASITPTLLDRVLATFRCEYVQTYGLTETSPYLTFSTLKRTLRDRPEAERRRFLARTGRPALGVELRVVDETGRDVPRDDRAVGEIRVRAPWVTPGYWHRPEETAAAFEDGWFKTGDLATWDAEGYADIVDRKKDVIVTGAEKVYSLEVERALSAHPAVDECAVVGLPDEEWGEIVCAAIVVGPGPRPSEEEIAAHLRERLAGFKVPRKVFFVDSLPKTGSGKIRKRELARSLRPD